MVIAFDPRERLQELSRQRGHSLAQLSALIGRNPTYLQQFVRKGSPRRLEERDRRMLAGFLGVDEVELGAPEEIYRESTREDWAAIPRLALGASAGPGAFVVGEEPIGTLTFSNRWLREQGLSSATLSTIVVQGDSMEPTLRDGDEILVDRTPHAPRDGIHVVNVDGMTLVKRLSFARPGTIMLGSDNRAYDPVELPAAEVQLIGRVVWKGGRI